LSEVAKAAADPRSKIDVLNVALQNCHPKFDLNIGIAYDSEKDRLFVTGKWWLEVYEIKLTPISNLN